MEISVNDGTKEIVVKVPVDLVLVLCPVLEENIVVVDPGTRAVGVHVRQACCHLEIGSGTRESKQHVDDTSVQPCSWEDACQEALSAGEGAMTHIIFCRNAQPCPTVFKGITSEEVVMITYPKRIHNVRRVVMEHASLQYGIEVG